MSRVSLTDQLANPSGLQLAQAKFAAAPTAARVLQIPNGSGNAVMNNLAATLINKTIVAGSNNVAAQALISSNVIYNVSSAAAPVAGQLLTYSGSALNWAGGTLPGETLFTGIANTTGSEGVTLLQVPVPFNSVTFVRGDVAVRSTGVPTNAASYRFSATFQRGPTAAASDSTMIYGGSANNEYVYMVNNAPVDTLCYPRFMLDTNNNNAPILYGYSDANFGPASWKYGVEVLSV